MKNIKQYDYITEKTKQIAMKNYKNLFLSARWPISECISLSYVLISTAFSKNTTKPIQWNQK